MPLWAHRTTFQVLPSVAEADLPEPVGNYVEEPELSAVAGWPLGYWILTGDVFTLADQAARDAIDVASQSSARDLLANEMDRVESYMRGFVLVLLDEINLLRSQHSLADRTPAQLKTAIRSKLDV